jgi:hypothetical protein
MAHWAIVRDIRFEPAALAGSVEATLSVLFVEDSTNPNAAEAADVAVVLDLADLVRNPRQQFTEAIRSHAATLGLTVGPNMALAPELQKG